MNTRHRHDRTRPSGERPQGPAAAAPSEAAQGAPTHPGPAGAPATEPESLVAPAGRGTVFLVDDDEALRRALNRLLSSCGFRVLSFGSAEEFLERYQPDQRGCLLLDMRMPGRSGLDLQSELERAGADLPIVFLTGNADARTRQLALQQGAVAFLEKPAREPDLLAALDLALSRG